MSRHHDTEHSVPPVTARRRPQPPSARAAVSSVHRRPTPAGARGIGPWPEPHPATIRLRLSDRRNARPKAARPVAEQPPVAKRTIILLTNPLEKRSPLMLSRGLQDRGGRRGTALEWAPPCTESGPLRLSSGAVSQPGAERSKPVLAGAVDPSASWATIVRRSPGYGDEKARRGPTLQPSTS